MADSIEDSQPAFGQLLPGGESKLLQFFLTMLDSICWENPAYPRVSRIAEFFPKGIPCANGRNGGGEQTLESAGKMN